MKIRSTALQGVKLIEPDVYGDPRGFFLEYFNQPRFRDEGLDLSFAQLNHSRSGRGVLRGLHYQLRQPQGKLVQVFQGRVFDVAVDLRVGSPTFAQWHGVILDEDNALQFYVPPGFLHGYYVMSERALFGYKTTDIYSPESELSVRWDDTDIGIEWPLDGEPTLSTKDRSAPLLAEISESRMSRF